MSTDAPPPLVGRATLTPADGAVLLKASRAWVGFFNQPRMLLYSALSSFVAAVLCVDGYERWTTVLILLAAVLYVLAIFAGYRTARRVSGSYGRNQEREVVLDDDGVTVREPGMSVTYQWSRFDRVIALPEHLVLIAGPGVVVIAKRAFDAETFVRVRELIGAKIIPREARR
jgi:YcxB-like protein